MLIYLIGFMGSGKTTVGKKLASRLQFNFLDLDRCIEEGAGMSISDIFARSGESAFREIEKNTLESTYNLHNTVVSLGGGTPCFFDNMKSIRKHGLSIYLQLHPNSLTIRLMNSTDDRPLLMGKNEDQLREYVESMLAKREEFYLQSKIVFKGESVDIEELVGEIKNVL